MLKQAKTPLYLFDSIMKWARDSATYNSVDFSLQRIQSREIILENLKSQFDLHLIEPNVTSHLLRGSGCIVDIVTHNFKHSLYSLLIDEELMSPTNLLINLEEFNITPNISQQFYINDIHTGQVYIKACKFYNKHENDILCPIIFFIDKTHTDLNGRLCLEQVRFTLGIFNRETRNKVTAWQTLGYVADQQKITAPNPLAKVEDYHHVLEIILKDFKTAQQQSYTWAIKCSDNTTKLINLNIPVLFIIGDTDGHDKLAGRYLSRSNIQRLCRYCDCPFDLTDDPEYKFAYTMHFPTFRIIERKDPSQLQKLSMHPINNAWKYIKFCDTKRGLFGSICADVMHCLQHGLFMYLINMFFDQKKFKETVTNEEGYESHLSTSRSVFSTGYSKHFDQLARQYGKILLHQSDRELPRTHFNTNYTSTTRKNASEMSGMLIVFLCVLNSDEGTNKIDKEMGEGRTTQFIHIIELMLLLESFCLSTEHLISNVKLLKKFMPYILNTLKNTLNRQSGCQMKIIKFHLPNHFADDILRFGSMVNFDTGIGESHHKSEAKHPAQNTQRRKSKFEIQTATRQIENIAINIAHAYIDIESTNKVINDQDNKWFCYVYDSTKKFVLS